MQNRLERRSAKRKDRTPTSGLTLLIAERANRLAQERGGMPIGGELALWLEAEAEVKRELREARASSRRKHPGIRKGRPA